MLGRILMRTCTRLRADQAHTGNKGHGGVRSSANPDGARVSNHHPM
jgi:N-glycosidase YbiA